jgi:hypothetical protein
MLPFYLDTLIDVLPHRAKPPEFVVPGELAEAEQLQSDKMCSIVLGFVTLFSADLMFKIADVFQELRAVFDQQTFLSVVWANN